MPPSLCSPEPHLPHLAWPRVGGVAWARPERLKRAADNGRAQREQNIHSEVGVAAWLGPSFPRKSRAWASGFIFLADHITDTVIGCAPLTPKQAWPLGWSVDEICSSCKTAMHLDMGWQKWVVRPRAGHCTPRKARPVQDKAPVPLPALPRRGPPHVLSLPPPILHTGSMVALVTSCHSALLPHLCYLQEPHGAPLCPAGLSNYLPRARASPISSERWCQRPSWLPAKPLNHGSRTSALKKETKQHQEMACPLRELWPVVDGSLVSI